jgi:putative intracellular protease/amidase
MHTTLATTLLLGLGLGATLTAPAHALPGAPRQQDVAQVLYVSPAGDDTGTGTRTDPLRTPQVAVDRIPDGGTVRLLPGTYQGERIVLRHRHGVTVAATRSGPAVLDATGLQPLLSDSGVVQISGSTRVLIRGLDIRGYRTTSLRRVPIGIYVTGHDRHVTLRGNHVHRLGNDNGTLGSFDINAHGIAAYGRDPNRPISDLRIVDNEVDHLHLGASESVVVNGNVNHWRIVRNLIHDNDNIGIDAIGWEPTLTGRHRYTTANRARHGTIAQNRISRIISQGNPAYWENGSWCNCADGIYVDGGEHIAVSRNIVRQSDIGIEVGAENHLGHTNGVTVSGNRVSGSRYVGLALGGYNPSRGDVYDVRVRHNHFRNDNTDNDGSPELLLQFKVHETTLVDNTVVATHRRVPLLLQRVRLVGPAAENRGVRLDRNHYRSPVPATRAEFVWLGHELTGFSAYRNASRQDTNSTCRRY